MHFHQPCTLCVCLCYKICIHSEEATPGVLILRSPKLEKLGSFFVSCSLLDNSGFEEEDDDRESKRHEPHDESYVSFCFSPIPVEANKKSGKTVITISVGIIRIRSYIEISW